MKIALLHALPFDERLWEPQLPALAGHEVHAPTLYGLGSSMDEWALGVLQQVPGKLVAVGASMGGYCASAIARLAPERLEAIRDRPDSTEAVTSGIPLLVVAGGEDKLIPAEVARELAAASPNGRAEIVEGCGHLPGMERPDEFNLILTTFLRGL
jgi:pimeloyl-ACP methyl ester carboxylesterase